MNVMTYSSAEVCEITGVTYRQLTYWCNQGVYRPSENHADGSGYRHRWTREDVYRVKVLGALVALRVEGPTLKRAGNLLRAMGEPSDWIDGGYQLWIDAEGRVFPSDPQGRGAAIRVDLAALAEEAREQLMDRSERVPAMMWG